jgi:hypothetical protein
VLSNFSGKMRFSMVRVLGEQLIYSQRSPGAFT